MPRAHEHALADVEGARSAVTIAGLPGSIRSGGSTHLAVQIALEGAAESGVGTVMLDLASYDLPLCDGTHPDVEVPAGVLRLRRDLRAVQGVILGTPEYHGSFSGALKTALDWIGFEELEGKMVGLVGVSAGQMGAVHALDGLRAIGRALHAWVVPEQATIAEVRRYLDAEGNLTDERLRERLKGVGRQVAQFASLHNSTSAREFLYMWEAAPQNPGAQRT
jgi:NAD(P)H-dependent FMN reductase